MNDVKFKKVHALNEIFNSFELYKGGYCSNLETEILKLRSSLNEDIFNILWKAFEDYRDYIFKIMARSERVFIRFNQNNYNAITTDNLADLDKLFKSME